MAHTLISPLRLSLPIKSLKKLIAHVPATNINLGNCTGGACGTWSEGIQVGDAPAGFSTIAFSHDEDEDTHRAILKTWSEEGELRDAFVLTPDTAVVNQEPVYVEM